MIVNSAEVNNKTKLYVVQNGIGKVSLFSNFIEELCEKDQNYISIASPHPELFSQHPKVISNLLAGIHQPELYEKYFSDIIYAEPYFSEYNKGKEHLLVSWRRLLGLNTENFEDYTDIITDERAKKYYEDVKTHLKKPYIIVQLKGGTNMHTDSVREDSMIMRNYSNEYELIKYIHDTFTNHFIMIIKTHNDLYDERVDKLERICTVEDESILVVQEMINNCDTFVSIDSLVQHLACNKNNPKKGVVLWSNVTSPKQIGHNLHVNLQSESLNSLKVNYDLIVENLKSILNLV